MVELDMFQGMLKALLATIVIEELTALFWKEQRGRLFFCVLIANLITNPAINLVVRFAPDAFYVSFFHYYCMIIVLEAIVWSGEALLFWRFGRIRSQSRALLFSLTLNSMSYFSGFPLAYLGFWD